MKYSDVKRIYEENLKHSLPGYACKGRLIFFEPAQLLLKAFSFQPSSFDSTFAVECFIQPLYLPREHLVFNIGGRLKHDGRQWFHPDSDIIEELTSVMKAKSTAFHQSIQSPADLASFLRESKCGEPYSSETIAYSLCLDPSASRRDILDAFQRLFDLLEVNRHIDWVQNRISRAAQFLDDFKNDAESGREILHRWSRETKSALKIK